MIIILKLPCYAEKYQYTYAASEHNNLIFLPGKLLLNAGKILANIAHQSLFFQNITTSTVPIGKENHGIYLLLRLQSSPHANGTRVEHVSEPTGCSHHCTEAFLN